MGTPYCVDFCLAIFHFLFPLLARYIGLAAGPMKPEKEPAVVRTHPRVWERIRKKWLESPKPGVAGQWNARKAQLAVKEYKKYCSEKFSDTGYSSPKSPTHSKTNSLAKWTKEKWDYVGKPGGRYLPEKVRESMSKGEKAREDRRKKGKLGVHVPYSKSVTEKMRTLKIV